MAYDSLIGQVIVALEVEDIVVMQVYDRPVVELQVIACELLVAQEFLESDDTLLVDSDILVCRVPVPFKIS